MSWIVFAVLAIIDFLTMFMMMAGGRYFDPRLARWRSLTKALQLQKAPWPEGDVVQQARKDE